MIVSAGRHSKCVHQSLYSMYSADCTVTDNTPKQIRLSSRGDNNKSLNLLKPTMAPIEVRLRDFLNFDN